MQNTYANKYFETVNLNWKCIYLLIHILFYLHTNIQSEDDRKIAETKK